MPYIKFQAKRKGFSIVESIILMIVLVVAIGAVLQTMSWAMQTYAENRQHRDSREVLFNWVQTFESMWPPAGMPISGDNVQDEWKTAAERLIEDVAESMGTWDDANKTALVSGYIVSAAPGDAHEGSMELDLVISSGRKTWIRSTQNYNVYTTDTVSDDSLKKGA